MLVRPQPPSAEAAPATRSLPILAREAEEEAAGGVEEGDGEEEGDEEIAGAEAEEPDYTVVEVFYGTDRAAVDSGGIGGLGSLPRFYLAAFSAAITVLLALLAWWCSQSRILKVLTAVSLIAAIGLGISAGYARFKTAPVDGKLQRAYGGGRGVLEMGTCEVSIPKDHEVGELESPSVFRLEFSETPERHVVLLGVKPQEADEFFKALGERVARSEKKEAFVFVHGYNVTFEDAARRTAQLAFDLDCDSAPIFYSWPSQGSLLGYSADEDNVVWTVPNLKEFLVQVATRSGAASVNLIAHSMGNRALTSALRILSYELREEARIFHQIVLTAPDIDAEVFKRDLAPRILKTGNRVTLYASSNDEALAASKVLHRNPRAGESGEHLVVVPGVDTIDVSTLDTSLVGLGHSYYGSNDTVLTDLVRLLHDGIPPDQRQWLLAMHRGELTYWIFRSKEVSLDPARRVPR